MEYKRALHLFTPSENGWIPKVEICSSIKKHNIDGVGKSSMNIKNGSYQRIKDAEKGKAS